MKRKNYLPKKYSVYQLSLIFFALVSSLTAQNNKYNPLILPDNFKIEWHDLAVKDSVRNRIIPVRIYLPVQKFPAAVILFSHGLGGSREGSVYLAEHWSARGYLCVFVQHPGSDEGVWKDKPVLQRMIAMKNAVSLKNFILRVKDISAVLDQLEKWNKNKSHPLHDRIDLSRIGMSGHSFGAVTTQAVSGQNFKNNISFTDARIKAAIMFSPSSPRQGLTPVESFGNVKIPWMLMTGTNDISVIGDQNLESRLAVFPSLPPVGKYEVVLYKAEHSAFADRALPFDKEERNPNHHKVILALSTAFWDAYLNNISEAKIWIDGDGPLQVLDKEDRWQKK